MGEKRFLAVLAALTLSIITMAYPAVAASPSPSKSPVPVGHWSPIPGSTAKAPPALGAKSWLIADATTGSVLAESNGQLPLPPASTLKTLTALTLAPRLQGDSIYTAVNQDIAADGSHVGLVAGATYTVNDLFQGLLLHSGNDAASALANANGGWAVTLQQMASEAQRLGLNHTVVKNPSGLDAAGQVSTAQDLATILRGLIDEPAGRKLFNTMSYDFPGNPSSGTRSTYQIASEDRLRLSGYPGAIAGKTGFTTHAGRTFVSAAERNGHTLVLALMQIDGPTLNAARDLMDWGFANVDKVQPVGQLPTASPQVETLTAAPAAQLTLDGKPSGKQPMRATSGTTGGKSTAVAIPAAQQQSQPDTDTQADAESAPVSNSVTLTHSATAKATPLWRSVLNTVLIILGLLIAAVVALRIRAVKRQRERAEQRRAAQAASASWNESDSFVRLPEGASRDFSRRVGPSSHH